MWVSMLMKDHIYAKAGEFKTHPAVLTTARTQQSVFRDPEFGSILHPGHAVAVGIGELYPRPGREYDY
jgi:hypothetical protein